MAPYLAIRLGQITEVQPARFQSDEDQVLSRTEEVAGLVKGLEKYGLEYSVYKYTRLDERR